MTISDKNVDLLFRVINFNPKIKINKLVNKAPTWKKKIAEKINAIVEKYLEWSSFLVKLQACNLQLSKSKLLYRCFPVTYAHSVDSLLTFYVVPIWRTQHELSKATFDTIKPRISEAAH